MPDGTELPALAADPMLPAPAAPSSELPVLATDLSLFALVAAYSQLPALTAEALKPAAVLAAAPKPATVVAAAPKPAALDAAALEPAILIAAIRLSSHADLDFDCTYVFCCACSKLCAIGVATADSCCSMACFGRALTRMACFQLAASMCLKEAKL